MRAGVKHEKNLFFKGRYGTNMSFLGDIITISFVKHIKLKN